MKKKFEVKIYDESHSVVSDRPEAEVKEIAAFVDAQLRSTMKAMKHPRLDKAAIVTALNIADELFARKKKGETERADIDKKLSGMLGRVEMALKG